MTTGDANRYARIGIELAVTLAGVAFAALAWRADPAWWEQHVLELHCTTRPWEPGAALATRVGMLAVAALIVLAARPRLGRWVGKDAGHAIGAVGRASVAVVLALVVSELLLRSQNRPPGVDVPATRPDPHLSRVLVPSSTTETVRGGRAISFAVDALGLRARRQDDRPDLSHPTLLVAGESIALGYAVPFEESAPYLVEQATGVQTLNASVSAYANDQVYRRMKEVLDLLAHPLAVVTFVVPPQIERNVDYRRERFVLGADGSLTVVAPATGFLRQSRLFELFDRIAPHSDAAFELARAIVVATAKDARARGAFPLFVATNFRVPCQHDESGESSLAHRLFAGLGVTHVSVDLDPRWSVPEDGHPDVRGSRALADAIVAELRRAKVLSPG